MTGELSSVGFRPQMSVTLASSGFQKLQMELAVPLGIPGISMWCLGMALGSVQQAQACAWLFPEGREGPGDGNSHVCQGRSLVGRGSIPVQAEGLTQGRQGCSTRGFHQ